MAGFWDWLANAPQYSNLPPDPNAIPKPGQSIQPSIDPQSVAPVLGHSLAAGMFPDAMQPVPPQDWADYNKKLAALPPDYVGKIPSSPLDDISRTPVGAALQTAGMFADPGAGLGLKAAAAGVLPFLKRGVGAVAKDAAEALPATALRAWAEPAMSADQLARAGIPAPIQPGDMRISSRFPTAKTADENPLTQHLGITIPEWMRQPGFEHNANIVPSYPGFAKFAGMAPADIVNGASDQMRGNMGFIHQNSPRIIQERSPLWYDGANNISSALSDRWGIPRQSVSGAIAALSPQKDWFMNASNAERAGDIMFGPAASKRMTPEMEQMFRSIGAYQSAPKQATFAAIQGKSLQQVLDDPLSAAMWIRLYDQAHHSPSYRSITPEGNFGPPVLTNGGVPEKRAWNSDGEIAKAVRSLQSGGDINTISPAMGEANKVRSFFNNIEVPNDTRFGDVTADTHQVAAAQMRPLSGKSAAVYQNFGNHAPREDQGPDWIAPKSSAFDGIGGTYPLYVDATRRFAGDLGAVPRAAQSPAWEAVRELFPDTFKNAKNSQVIDDIWRAHDQGSLTLDQARKRILDFAAPDGIREPAWARSSAPTSSPTRSSSYR